MRSAGFIGVIVASGLVCACDNDIRFAGDDPEPPVIITPPPAPEEYRRDSYEQIQKPEVDILWVVDNSCSMESEQEALGTNFPIFMDYFLNSNLDYHIGVVSTDMDDPAQSGKLVQAAGERWITPESPSPEETFAAMSLLGTAGSGNEQGILATYAAMELQDEHNDGFWRENSAIHVIVVSDESDGSPDNPVTLVEFAGYLNGLRADPAAVEFHSIVAEKMCDSVQSLGTRYIDVTDRVGGVFWSLCDENWGGALEAIGLETAGLKREYFLSARPVPGTVKVSEEFNGYTRAFVEYDPVAAVGDWTWSEERNSVTFVQYVPEPGAVIHIDYRVLAASERGSQ